MTRRAVIICPGRGTYNRGELGYLHRHHADRQALFAGFDAHRTEQGQKGVWALDGAETYRAALYTRGDIASPLIYACTYADALTLAPDIQPVAVTGNSMGWYSALGVAGALTGEDGFRLVNTMGTLMQDNLTGGQLVYPVTGNDWAPDPARRADILSGVAEIAAQPGHDLALSIDLGGALVLAGNEAGLKAFEAAVPGIDGRFPMRLPNHAAFHTTLMDPIAAQGRARLSDLTPTQPDLPLIDGRGAIWWPRATDTADLWRYTLGHQVTEPYDFAAAIRVAAREFAPDMFIVTGPGDTLGGAVAQALVSCGWRGMASKQDFETEQKARGLLVSMGRAGQGDRVRASG